MKILCGWCEPAEYKIKNGGLAPALRSMKKRLFFSFIVGLFCARAAHAINDGVDFLELKNTPAPSAIVDASSGVLNLGWFSAPFQTVNPEAAFPGLFKCLRKKEWQFFSLASQSYVIGFAAVDAGYVSTLFAYAFEIQTKRFWEYEKTAPGGKAASIAKNSLSGETVFTSDTCSLKIENNLDQKAHSIDFDCADYNGNRLIAYGSVHEEGSPLVNSREVAKKRIVYTHQNSMCRPDVSVYWNDKLIYFDPDKDFATMDYTVGFHNRHTTWNWSAAGGYATDGTPVAVNFAMDIGTGSNTVPVYWIGRDIYRIERVIYDYDMADPMQEWKIYSPDNSVDLTFQPLGMREGKKDIGILMYDIKQPFGFYNGTIKAMDGKTYTIENMIGIAEKHIARW